MDSRAGLGAQAPVPQERTVADEINNQLLQILEGIRRRTETIHLFADKIKGQIPADPKTAQIEPSHASLPTLGLLDKIIDRLCLLDEAMKRLNG